jgi:hypothetical protein
MREFLNILKDIQSGALPASEIPGFIAWLFQKSYWLWLAIMMIVIAIWLGK